MAGDQGSATRPAVSLRRRPLLRRFLELGFPAGHFVIAGSGPLLAAGLVTRIRDLDVVARGPAWTRALALGTPEPAPESSVRRVLLDDGRIEVLDGWYPERWSTDDLIDTAVLVDGLPFVALEVVRQTKLARGTARDLRHVALIDELIAAGREAPART